MEAQTLVSYVKLSLKEYFIVQSTLECMLELLIFLQGYFLREEIVIFLLFWVDSA